MKLVGPNDEFPSNIYELFHRFLELGAWIEQSLEPL